MDARGVVLVIACIVSTHATAEPTPRILLVGDSWAERAWQARAFKVALENRGLRQFEEKGDVTAIGGTTSSDWATPPFLRLITDELEAHPTLDIVHLSIGGNDFLQSPPSSPLDALLMLLRILRNTRTVVEHIHVVRPEARIAYATYDYVPLGGGFAFELGMLARAIRLQTRAVPNYVLLDQLGVLHHEFGYPGAFGPGERPLPGGYPLYQPILGGDPHFPGSLELFDDPIHPNQTALVALAEYAVDEFYGGWLAPRVAIDVRPATEINAVYLDRRELLPVAVLGSIDFSVSDVDVSTLAFGSGGAPARRVVRPMIRDVNRDGLDDLVGLYPVSKAVIDPGDTEACLSFRSVHGVPFTGCDEIWTR
jgi:hypothetical protein